METTTIEISVENWQWMSSLKERPGDSFDDVLTRLREQYEQADNLETATAGHDGDNELEDTTIDTSHELQDKVKPVDVPDNLDLPGSGELYERRRQAIGTLAAYLKKEGTATRSDFLEVVDPDDIGYSSANSFWSNAIKGRDSLSSIDGIVPPSEGEHTWRYDPDE